MQLLSIVCFLITVSLKILELEAKLALEHSLKSSEILNNTIYNNNNNEISEVEQSNDKEEVEDEIQQLSVRKQELGKNFNDVERVEKLKNQIKAIKKASNIIEINNVKKNFKRPEEKPNHITIKTTKIPSTTKNTFEVKTKPMHSEKNSTQFFNTKTQRPTIFINPFGQLSAFFGSDQLHYLQDYNFLFNAEKHTIFQLHTSLVKTTNNHGNSAGRMLNAVVSGSLSAALGVNTVTAAGVSTEKIEEVQLYNAASLRQSRFNPFNPTRILIHGWFGGSHAGVYNTLVPEYLKLENGTYNIFTVDWGRGAIADYITASYRVKPVGKVVAKFIDFLHRESGMRFEDLQVIGFSMGAHIAGIAGKFVQTGRIRVIYALDPALPLFRYENIDERIALTDADYVEVIHTSVGSYGYDRPLGHVDFYVNYGSGQPGCFFNECSHFRAFQVFAESLHNPKAFCGQGCDVKLWLDLINYRRCLMGTGRNLTLGGNITDAETLRKRGGGVYYLTTNANSPFG